MGIDFFGISILVALVWGGIGIWLPPFLVGSVKAGSFGDQFGAVNALFSGLAFAGVIYAVVLQSKELALQREELEQTRQVLREQKQQLENQNETMQQQRFENTFFQMVSLHNEIVDQLVLKEMLGGARNLPRSEFKGRRCFVRLNQILIGELQEQKSISKKDKKYKSSAEIYEAFYDQYQYMIGHYFRNLYTIIKIIDQSTISNKRDFTNIVRAQLSSNELTMLFYNCISPWGEKFKPLVEKYALLKTLPEGKLADESDRRFYSPTAFGIQ